MNCEKCGSDAPVYHCDVDGFAYYLCVTCSEAWDAVRDGPRTGRVGEAVRGLMTRVGRGRFQPALVAPG